MIKTEALNFSIAALAAGEHGDLDTAIDAIENTAHMGNTLASEPNDVSQMVRLACYHIAISDTERLLSRRPLSIVQINRLTILLEELRTPGGLRLADIGLRIDELDILADLERGPVLQTIKPMQSNRRILLTECDRLLALGDADKSEVLREYKTIEEGNLKNAQADTNSFLSVELSWGMLRGLEIAAHKFARYEAHRRAAITALAVERYRIEHQGKLPPQLTDLTPQYLKEIPLDPVSGKPFYLKQMPVGFVVGSSGIENGEYKRLYSETTFTIER
jgi:hypothetical protein